MSETLDFVRSRVRDDLANGVTPAPVATRFPPEPNGYLHIGHAKSIALNFGIAEEFGGTCNLRFDDTNPEKEEVEFVDSIKDDIRWLGFDWGERLFFASDYFPQLYEWATFLIERDLAYVDELSPEQVREYRGTPTEAGRNSPWRDRPRDENARIFAEMREGIHPEGAYVLRAKIDMAHPNITMRDPALYRIRHAAHHRTGTSWCIYPTYDYAHGQSDALEGITHSICTLEFENHRPLYDWLVEHLPVPSRPYQIEFARLNLTYTVMSKRKLRRLVEEGYVDGWDDPRMPTLRGLRRRGYTPTAIRAFLGRVGVAKTNSVVDLALLEFSLREELNAQARRLHAVVDPIRLVITNWPDGHVEHVRAPFRPDPPAEPTDAEELRDLSISGSLWIERDDFVEEAPRKWFRLAPGQEVRLKYAYYVTCTGFERDADGRVSTVYATYDPESRGGETPDGRKVKGTLHWLSTEDAVPARMRLYDALFSVADPEGAGADFVDAINPDSLVERDGFVEPAAAALTPGEPVQFLRMGYFVRDSRDPTVDGRPVFNRAVTLKDGWARVVRNDRQND